MKSPHIEPLSAEERRWVARLERVLRDQPSRLLLVESADMLMVVDRAAAAEARLEDGGAHRSGVVLHDVRHGTGKVTGVS